MIKIENKSDCCGCNACGDICPKEAISYHFDNEGFLYPKIDEAMCIGCGLCERVCPLLKDFEPNKPINCFAAINLNEEERNNSSSGGVFSLLMKKTIEEDGVVFGAAFDDNWMIRHYPAQTLQDTYRFQGSKYVQSNVSGCYKAVKKALNEGRKVLFSGTACQIAALHTFLGRQYENLLTVDVVCHGVPSPGIWQDYLLQEGPVNNITDIRFRDKSSGWKNYSFLMAFRNKKAKRVLHHKNIYMQGFLNNLYLRPSCHSCSFKGGRCGSDITLGDFWGIEKVSPKIDDDKGVSVVLVNSEKGKAAIYSVSMHFEDVSYEQAIQCNSCIVKSTPESKWRSVFWEHYGKEGLANSIHYITQHQKPSVIKRILNKIKNVFSSSC